MTTENKIASLHYEKLWQQRTSSEYVMRKERYDFIVTCEVVEHLFNPIDEFKKLRSWLKPKGALVAKTHLWAGHDIHNWYYSRDPTHVSFYSQPNLEKIKEVCGYQSLNILDSRLFILRAPV